MKKIRLILEVGILFICLGVFVYRFNEQKEVYVNLFKGEKAKTAWSLYLEGKTLDRQDKYEEAIKVLKESIELSSDVGKVHVMLGLAYYHNGESEKAVEEYKRALELDMKKKNVSIACFDLAIIYNQMERYEEAMELLKRSIELSPEYGDVHTELGLVYFNIGEYEKAEEEYKTAFQLELSEWDRARTHYDLGLVYRDRKMDDKAIAQYKLAIETDPTYIAGAAGFYGDPHAALAEVYIKQGRYDEAIEEARESLKINPEGGIGHYKLVVAYMFKNDMILARKTLVELRNIDKELANELKSIMDSPQRDLLLKEKYRD